MVPLQLKDDSHKAKVRRILRAEEISISSSSIFTPFLKVRLDDTTLLHETRGSVPMEHCPTLLQVFPTMSDCDSWEHTASCSQDVVEGLGAMLHGAKLHSVDWPLRPVHTSEQSRAIRVHEQSSLQRPHEWMKFTEQQAQLGCVWAWDQPVEKQSSLSRKQLFEMISRARSCGRAFRLRLETCTIIHDHQPVCWTVPPKLPGPGRVWLPS